MNGGMVLDANIVLYALRGLLDETLPPSNIRVSVITEIELPGYPNIDPAEETVIRALLAQLEIVPLSPAVKEEAIRLRRASRLRLPDAVILAMAIVTGSELRTNDQTLIAGGTGRCRPVCIKPAP